MTTLNEWLGELEKVEKAATPAKWQIDESCDIFTDEVDEDFEPKERIMTMPYSPLYYVDFKLVVECRNALPKLIEIIRIQQEALMKYSKEPEWQVGTEKRWSHDDEETGQPIYAEVPFKIKALGYRTHIAQEALDKIKEVVSR